MNTAILRDEAESRALVAGTDSAGGFVTPELWATEAAKYLAASSVVLSAKAADGRGMRIIDLADGTGDTIFVPKISAGATAGMIAEAGTLSPTDPTFARITLRPQKGYVDTILSNEVLADSNPSIRQLVAEDHIAQLARLFDSQFLQGNGSAPNLRGILSFSGVNSVAHAATLADLDVILAATNRLLTNNANPDRAVIFMHPRLWTQILTLKTGIASDKQYLASKDVTRALQRQLFGYPVYLSSQLSVNQGTGTNGTPFAVVDLDQVVICRRAAIEVRYSEHVLWQTDQTVIRTLARFDIGNLNTGGVELVTDVKP